MNAKEAKKILPKQEYEAFEAIFMRQTSMMGTGRLKQLTSLSRRLRNKYRDLSKRQGADVRHRRTNTTDTSLYDRRARTFQDLLEFLEREIEHRNSDRSKQA